MYTVDNLVRALEAIAPSHLAEKWDNVGLLIGSRKKQVRQILCALDLNAAVLDEAIAQGANCIVTHHPFIFSPLKRLDLDSPRGQMIETIIKHDIAVYAMHTNLDIVTEGINDVLCDKFGIKQTQILHVTHSEPLIKFCVYVPETHVEAVREALIMHNDYAIGNYTGCTFGSKGEGTFVPLEGSHPYVGEESVLEKVQEVKLECLMRPRDLGKVLGHIQEVHPYEEIAYDVFELKHIRHEEGLGRYGSIVPTTVGDFAKQIKDVLGAQTVRIVGDQGTVVDKVALCSGSGSSFLGDAAKVAKLYITGDLKFHEAQEALERGLCIIDVGHYASENIMIPVLCEKIVKQLPGIEAIASTINAEVFQSI